MECWQESSARRQRLQQLVTDPFGAYSVLTTAYLKELVAGFAITASLVCDDEGNTVNQSGSSAGLGNQTDLALLVALRRKSQLVLTSGRTFRADSYRFPKQADLAVLTNQSIQIDIPAGQRLLTKNSGYTKAVLELCAEGYSRIHIEYGITGIRELVAHRQLDALFLSSESLSGVDKLARNLAVTPSIYQLEDLYIGMVAWQPALR